MVRSAFCVSIIYPLIQDNLNNKVQDFRESTKYRVYEKARWLLSLSIIFFHSNSRIKIAGRNRILSPLGIGYKTIENKSHLDGNFMNFNFFYDCFNYARRWKNFDRQFLISFNLVPRACDPREGTWGSGIIRFREESDWPLKWNA
jgi:hypothetical protein